MMLTIFTTVLLSCFLQSLVAAPTNTKEPRQLADVVYSCTKPNTVALTFDDGPFVYSYDAGKVLNEAGIKGTFFFTGSTYQCIYDDSQIDRVKFLYESGHQIGSHTWTHEDLATLSFDRVHDEMWKTEQSLKRILGIVPAFMRPPYGNFNDNVRKVAAARGQKLAIWDFDSEDSIGASPAESKAIYDKTISDHPDTILALNHETYERTVHEVLPYAIEQLKAAGYEFATLAVCLGEEPYQSVGEPEVKDPSWQCDQLRVPARVAPLDI